MKDEYEDDFSEDLDDEEFEEPDYDDIDWFFLFFIFNNNIIIIYNNVSPLPDSNQQPHGFSCLLFIPSL